MTHIRANTPQKKKSSWMSGMHKSGSHKKLAFQKAIGNIEQLTTLKRSKVIGVAYIRANVPKK